MIERVAYKCAKGLCADDLHSRLLIELVEHFDDYDKDRGTEVSWVYWRARKVRTYMFREVKNLVTVDETVFAQQPATHGTQAQIERVVRINEILSVATPRQAEAVFTVLNGLTAKELRAIVHMSPQSRNAHLYNLGGTFHKKRRTGNG